MGDQGAMGCKAYMTIEGAETQIVRIEKVSYPEIEKILDEDTGHEADQGFATYGDTGKRKMGAVTWGMIWDKGQATHAALLTAVTSSDPVVFKVEDPDSTDVVVFSAQVQKVGRVTEQGKVLRANVTLQPTGAPS